MTVVIYDEKGLREELTNVYDVCTLPGDKMHIHIHREGSTERKTYYIPLLAHISVKFD